ncbi:MAG: capsid cement protein [Candidatus Phlomobacter fragariae]
MIVWALQRQKAKPYKRGDKVYIVASGTEAGKVSKTSKGNIDLGYWVENVSAGSQCVAITLGYMKK